MFVSARQRVVIRGDTASNLVQLTDYSTLPPNSTPLFYYISCLIISFLKAGNITREGFWREKRRSDPALADKGHIGLESWSMICNWHEIWSLVKTDNG